MEGLLQSIVAWAIEKGLATEDGVDVFRDYLPNDPDAVLVFKEYDATTAPADRMIANRMLQALVRDVTPELAKERCDNLYEAFFDHPEIVRTLENGRWGLFLPTSPPLQLGRDDNDRVRYVFNFSVITRVD